MMPDLAVELDVVEVLGLGPRLERVGGLGVGELAEVLPERRVVVQGDLARPGRSPARRRSAPAD